MPQKFDISFDVRVIDRNLREGVITEKEYKEFVNKLDDTAENAAPVETTLISEDEQEDSEEINVESEKIEE